MRGIFTTRCQAVNDPVTENFYTGNTTTIPGIGLLRDYYAWQWGDALFIVIAPYWSSPAQLDTGLGGHNSTSSKTQDIWAITDGDAQYMWLKQTLEQSTAKWKFVSAHHVMGTGRGGIEAAKQRLRSDALFYARFDAILISVLHLLGDLHEVELAKLRTSLISVLPHVYGVTQGFLAAQPTQEAWILCIEQVADNWLARWSYSSAYGVLIVIFAFDYLLLALLLNTKTLS